VRSHRGLDVATAIDGTKQLSRQELDDALDRASALVVTSTPAPVGQFPPDGFDILNDAELARHRVFASAPLAARFAETRIALRRLLGSLLDLPPNEVRIRVGPNGKPMLAEPARVWFNVAHTDNASLILTGRALVAVHDATFLLGPAFCAAIGNGLILGYLMFRSGLVPRRFAQFGMLGGSLALVTALLVLFGAYDQTSGASFVLTLPEAVWELSLGIYLIAKGFKPSPILYDAGARAGVDGPLMPMLAAADAAVPLVAAP